MNSAHHFLRPVPHHFLNLTSPKNRQGLDDPLGECGTADVLQKLLNLGGEANVWGVWVNGRLVSGVGSVESQTSMAGGGGAGSGGGYKKAVV